MATTNKQNCGLNRWVVSVTFVLISGSLVDCVYDVGNEPCSSWDSSSYWRGVCWKILEDKVELPSVLQTDLCQMDHTGAKRGIPTDQGTLQLLSTLIKDGDHPYIWNVNGSSNPYSQIIVADPPAAHASPPPNCTVFDVSTGLVEDTEFSHHRVLCFLEVGNPCGDSDWTGDLYQSSCYFHDHQRKTWGNAQTYCEDKGGYLVEIQNAQEQVFLSGVVFLLNMTGPVLVGAQRKSNVTGVVGDAYVWDRDGTVLALEGALPGSGACVGALMNGTDMIYTRVDCNRTEGYHYICEQEAPTYQYLIHFPEVASSETYIALMTSSNLVSTVITVYDNGNIINSTSFLLSRQHPVKHRIYNVLDLLLTHMDISFKAIHVTTHGKSEVSLFYASSFDNGNTLILADVTIYPTLFLDTYYVITGIRMKGDGRSFLSVIATQPNTTTIRVHFARRYSDVALEYNVFELINTGALYFEVEQFQSVLIESEDDLSGATVKANRQVAVYSGNKQVTWGCCTNYVMTQTMPFRHMTNEYLVLVPSDIYNSSGLYRLTATERETNVFVYDENIPSNTPFKSYFFNRVGSTRDVILSAGSFISLRSSVAFLLSFIGFYDDSNDNFETMPCLVSIPAIHLYRYAYVFNPSVLQDSWTRLWLSIIGKNINITDSDTISVNTKSLKTFIDENGISNTIHGENNNQSKAIVMEITDQNIELDFKSINQNSPFLIILYWKTQVDGFCRVLGINIDAVPDLNTSYSLTPTFENETSYRRSSIMWEQDSGGGYCTGNCSWTDSGDGGDDGDGERNPTATTTETASVNATTESVTAQPTSTESSSVDTNSSAECVPIPEYKNLSESEVQALIKDIQKKLFLDPKDVSSYTRKYISISDPRPSSTTMGVFGIMTFSVMVVSLLITDCISFSLFVVKWAKIFKAKYYG